MTEYADRFGGQSTAERDLDWLVSRFIDETAMPHSTPPNAV